MGHGGQGTRHPELAGGQNLTKADGGEDGKQTARTGIENGREISGEHRAEKNTDKQNGRRFLRPHGKDGEHRHNIGKTQLHPRDGHQRRNLGLDHEDRQGDGGEQGHLGQFFRIQGLQPPFNYTQ